MSEGGGSKGEESSQTRVDIPDFLRPYLGQLVGAQSRGVSNVENLASGDLVAGFNPDQEAAFAQARDVAGGGGGFLPIMQDLLRSTASGTELSEFLPSTAFNTLEGQAGGSDPLSFLPPEAREALMSTARGDHLFGTDASQAAINAAIEGALPGVSSAFGGSIGGLSGAASRSELGKFGVREGIANQQRERDRQLAAAAQLGGFGGQGVDNQFRAAGLLAGEGSRERDRALNAAGALPGAGLAGANILRDIGGQQQQLEQLMATAPLDAQMQILQLLMQGFPMEALLGQSSDRDFSQVSLGFGG